MKSDLRNRVTAESAFIVNSVKYSTTATTEVDALALPDALPMLSWCPTTGNNLVTINAAGGGWDASMTSNNLTGAASVTCAIILNAGTDPLGIGTSEGAPACKSTALYREHDRRGLPRRSLYMALQ